MQRIVPGLFAILVLCAFGLVWFDPSFRSVVTATWDNGGSGMGRTLGEIFLNPWFYGVFAFVLLLERLIPAKAGQGALATGTRQDLLWLFFKTALHAWFLPLYVVLLRHMFNSHLGFLGIEQAATWPWAGRLLFALLVGDFIFYLQHIVRHKVSVLWYFHAVHHSQKELNFFTEYRVHPIDDVFIYTLGFIPALMVEQSAVTLVAIVWIRHWHTRLYHANIRSNFGPLRYILVTPQSHRVHHSIEPRHRDTNYALTFSIWDHLFGTQYRGYDEYPDTGIDDERFPFEQAQSGTGPLGALLEQFLYPFRAIARGQ